MARGDHFFVWRRFGAIPFQHHAIDLGDGHVIHFSDGREGIASPSIDTSGFTVAKMPLIELTRAGRDKVFRVKHSKPSGGVDDVMRRAESQLGRRNYHLFHDNCEHFASWCVTGRASSVQVTTAAERASSVAVKTTIVVVARLAIKSTRVSKPWTLAADAVQFGTEVFGDRVGLGNPTTRKSAGKTLGGLTAVLIGALGGPLGIAVAGGTWVLGEVGGEVTARILAKKQSLRLRPDGESIVQIVPVASVTP